MAVRITGLNSGLDTDSIVQELVSAYSLKTEKYEKQKTKIEWKQDAWKSLNTKIYSLYTSASNLRFSSAYNTKKTTVSDATKATVTAGTESVAGTQKLNILKLAQSGYLTGGKLAKADNTEVTADTTLEELGYTGEETTITITQNDGTTSEVKVSKTSKVSDVVNGLKNAGVSANFDAGNGRLYISSKESGTAADFTVGAADADGQAALDALGLAIKTTTDANGNTVFTDDSAVKIDGSDAEIKLNGVTYTSTSNSFSINGLSITATGLTGDGDNNAITITTAVDVQGIYDKIKDFLTEYNNVVNEMTKLYNADSAGKYEPLTDDEKEAMSESEVEKWEAKIKDSLLRRDTTLNSVMTSMINSMAQSVEIDGKKYSLSSFGVHTLGYLNSVENEQYAYHIDGDEDDTNTSGNKDKLMKAIQDDPDTICEFMKQLTTNLYTAIDKKMKSTSLSSAYKVYNDKELDNQLDDVEDMIAKWEEKLAAQEEYYYQKFSAMETALSKLQNQTNSLTGLFNS